MEALARRRHREVPERAGPRDDEARAAYDNRDAIVETRAQQERPSVDSWLPPSVLPEIGQRDGLVHRWIRTSLLSKADNTNVSARFREGWEPCKREDYPELNLMSDRNTNFPNGIEIGGLLLCRAPTGLMEARKKYYQKKADDNMAAVDNNLMKESDPRMPIFKEGKSTVSFGKGHK